MKKKIVLTLWMLFVFASLAFYVSGQVPAAKLPQGNISPLEARIQKLEAKISELEKRVNSLEHPAPKILPVNR